MENFKNWLLEELPEYIQDIAEYGANNGFPHLTYTADCIKTFDRFDEEIWSRLNDDAEQFGYDNGMTFVGTFTRADMAYSTNGLKNLLLWYAAETVSRELVDEGYEFIDHEDFDPTDWENWIEPDEEEE